MKTTIIAIISLLLFSCKYQAKVNYSCDSTCINSDVDSLVSTVFIDINFTYLGGPISEERKVLYEQRYLDQLLVLNERFNKYNLVFRPMGNMTYFSESGNYTISQVRDMYFNDDTTLEFLLESIEVQGAINVFSFNFSEESSIMGYTPTLAGGYEIYKAASPKYDRIIVSDFGMENERTLIHELIHFFHASEDVINMSEDRRIELGIITYQDACDNEMSYSCCGRKMTNQQINNLVGNALTFRSYLLKDE